MAEKDDGREPAPPLPAPPAGAPPEHAAAPTDTRAQRRRFDRSLAWAVVIMLVGVGGTLIALIYGTTQAITGLLCLFAGSALFGFLWLILTLMGKWAGE